MRASEQFRRCKPPPPPLLSAQTGEDVAKSLGRAWGCGSSRHDSDAAQIKGP